MVDIFEYLNKLSQNVFHRREPKNFEIEELTGDLTGIENVREQMKAMYGWQSPYEYYYGSDEDMDIGSDHNTILSISEIESYEKDTGAIHADRNEIPNYFWIDSISNWCYFKISAYTPTFTKTYSWAPSWLRYGIGSITLGATEAIESISLDGWESWWKVPASLAAVGADSFASASMYYTKVIIDCLTGARSFAKTFSAVSIPFMIYDYGIGSFYSRTSDIDAEELEEQFLHDPVEKVIPREGISLYMWNGYTRSWQPMKPLIETYNRYCKLFSIGNYWIYLDKKFIPALLTRSSTAEKDEFIDAFFNTIPHDAETKEEFKSICLGDPLQIDVTVLSRLLKDDSNSSKYPSLFARTLIAITYGFDPDAFQFLTDRSPIDKKTVLGVKNDGGDSWGKDHIIESWTKWIPLPLDRAKIKQFANRSFQLINRPYSYIRYDWRDHNGWIHKNIGHPCFFRGNDDQLWMSYWMRWSTGYHSVNVERSLFTEKTTMTGAYDVSTDDVENWDSIIEAMFDKRDEYGFDEWMANADYGIAYKKFTISEESPNEILTYEHSTLNPSKTAPVNTVTDVEDSSLVLSLSTSTLISRENDTGVMQVAKRW